MVKPKPGPSFADWRQGLADVAEDLTVKEYAWLSWCEQVAEATRRMLVALEKIGYRLDP